MKPQKVFNRKNFSSYGNPMEIFKLPSLESWPRSTIIASRTHAFTNIAICIAFGYHVVGIFEWAQIFAYFEHIEIVRKLEPTKSFARDAETIPDSFWYDNFEFFWITVLQMSL